MIHCGNHGIITELNIVRLELSRDVEVLICIHRTSDIDFDRRSVVVQVDGCGAGKGLDAVPMESVGAAGVHGGDTRCGGKSDTVGLLSTNRLKRMHFQLHAQLGVDIAYGQL